MSKAKPATSTPQPHRAITPVRVDEALRPAEPLPPAEPVHSAVTTPVTPPVASGSLLRVLSFGVLALLAGLGVVHSLSRMGQVELIGELRAEQTMLYAPGSGRVLRIAAKSGDLTKPKQTLIELVDDSLDRRIAEAELALRSLEAELDQCRANAEVKLSLELDSLDDKLLKTRLETAKHLSEHHSAIFEHTMLRDYAKLSGGNQWLAFGPATMEDPQRLFQSVAPQPVVAPTTEDARQRAILKQERIRDTAERAKVNAELCEERVKKLTEHRADLPEKIRKAAGVNVAEGKLALATQQLQALQMQKAEMTIVARGHGIVGEFRKQPADPVIAGEALVMVLDRERPFVEVEIPSRRVNTIKVGQTLQLQFADEDFIGRIEAISPQAHRREGSNDTWIPVRIGPAGKLWQEMPIGTAVSVRLK